MEQDEETGRPNAFFVLGGGHSYNSSFLYFASQMS